MSKYVKDLLSQEVAKRLTGVADALLVNMIGLDSEKTFQLRKRLRDKKINVLVVKGSLAARATQGTSLAPAFEGTSGSVAVCWGSEDFISLAKEIVEINKDKAFEKFQTRGGVMDGERLTPERVAEISKWPNRGQQLSMLVGQILSVGAALASQINAPGGALASQIEKKSEGEEGAAEAPAAEASAGEAPAAEAAAT
jgi:large subunit ribosomal protein L10